MRFNLAFFLPIQKRVLISIFVFDFTLMHKREENDVAQESEKNKEGHARHLKLFLFPLRTQKIAINRITQKTTHKSRARLAQD